MKNREPFKYLLFELVQRHRIQIDRRHRNFHPLSIASSTIYVCSEESKNKARTETIVKTIFIGIKHAVWCTSHMYGHVIYFITGDWIVWNQSILKDTYYSWRENNCTAGPVVKSYSTVGVWQIFPENFDVSSQEKKKKSTVRGPSDLSFISPWWAFTSLTCKAWRPCLLESLS